MKSILFETTMPHNHVPRTLDILRTMGFDLIAMTLSKQDEGSYRVDLSYEPNGNLSDQTFVERVRALTAISTLRPTATPIRVCA